MQGSTTVDDPRLIKACEDVFGNVPYVKHALQMDSAKNMELHAYNDPSYLLNCRYVDADAVKQNPYKLGASDHWGGLWAQAGSGHDISCQEGLTICPPPNSAGESRVQLFSYASNPSEWRPASSSLVQTWLKAAGSRVLS